MIRRQVRIAKHHLERLPASQFHELLQTRATHDVPTRPRVPQIVKPNFFDSGPPQRAFPVANQFSARLRELDLPNFTLPRQPRNAVELQTFNKEFPRCIEVYTEALGLCTSIRMLAPVLAESFVNLVLFISIKPGIRNDDRLYESLFRQDVDVRVRSLNLNCSGFTKAVDVNDERFKQF